MTVFLSFEDLLDLIAELGVGPIRDEGLLDSAAHRPRGELFGVDHYPSIHLKGAALLESIVRNHALVDGNKRLGWHALFVFFDINDLKLEAPDDDAYDLVIAVASGQASIETVAIKLAEWT